MASLAAEAGTIGSFKGSWQSSGHYWIGWGLLPQPGVCNLPSSMQSMAPFGERNGAFRLAFQPVNIGIVASA